MSFGAWSSVLQKLVIPEDAGPDDVRVEINGDIPPALADVFPSPTYIFAQSVILYDDATHYWWQAIVRNNSTGARFVSMGIANGTNFGDTFPMVQQRLDDSEFGLLDVWGRGINLKTNGFGDIRIGNSVSNGIYLGLDTVESVQTPVLARVAESIADSDGFGFAGTEAELLSVQFSARAGRVYEIRYEGNIETTAAPTNASISVREDSRTGTRINQRYYQIWHTSTGGVPTPTVARYAATADTFKTIVVTGRRTSGSGTLNREGSSIRPARLIVDVVGGEYRLENH